ncbi:hypothetical protein ACR78H_25155 [Sphingobacterium siyangense]|uniref:hypothetical protein n=1 Tax=Sphingobacterium siyangense TaxID=459529 RepID=UPI003DA2A4A3
MHKIKPITTNDNSIENLDRDRHSQELNHGSDSFYYYMLRRKWLASADEPPKILKEINKNGLSANNVKY